MRIDTRELTKIVRESGVMNAIITDKPTLDPAKKKQLDEYVIKDAVKSVSCTQREWYAQSKNLRRELRFWITVSRRIS